MSGDEEIDEALKEAVTAGYKAAQKGIPLDQILDEKEKQGAEA